MAAKTGTKSPKKAVVVKKTMATKNPKPTKAQKFATTNLDSALVQKAVDAVLKYHEKKLDGASDKLVLLGDDRPVQVQLTLLRAPGKSQPKPAQLLIPNAFYKLADKSGNDSDDDDDDDDDDAEEPEICLIVKDESKPYCQEMIEKFPDHMGCVKKVLTLDSLRKKHSSYEQKRELLSKYNMFLADDRILPMMSKALGKGFIKAKKLPVPVDVTRQTALPFAIQKALSATYMTVNTGTCISIKAGHTGMDSKKLTENVLAIAKAAATKIPHSWANIQMIGVKTADSVSLPVYNKTPEALREIAKLAGVETKAPKEEASEKKPEKTKKKDLKSPLLAALKKQKKEGEQEAKKTKEEKKKKEPKTTETKAKRSSESTEPASSPQKKQKKEEQVAVEETKEKKVFVSAKKFKGAKKGYIFQMGTKGLGYYIDNVPKVDKMALQAIQRMGGAGGRGAKKAGKRRGRR
mmetsp:Transcript_3562/g.8508  ORF Transcript_3562/g.8508 Transcript_3562/m.8508 type:complete len:463 (+) Transcript_3562:90-1478(+)